MKDNIKYPERIYANFKSTAGGDVYGGYTNRPLLASDPFDNELYVRADLVPQWHDASKELPDTPTRLLV